MGSFVNDSDDFEWAKRPREHVLKAVFSTVECEKIIATHKKLSAKLDIKRKKLVRDSTLFWLPEKNRSFDWIFARLTDKVLTWNEKYYRFDISGAPRYLQLTKYAQGQHYDWHQDIGAKSKSRRKVSISTLLSPPGTFSGGDMEFFKSDYKRPRADLNQGDAVIFPSWMRHRVLPISDGERWSLVAWFRGPTFR